MRMDLGLTQTIKQIQTLSPQMYMSMEILCLNSMDLEERIDQELEENIALELAEPGGTAEKSSEEGSGEDGAGDRASGDGHGAEGSLEAAAPSSAAETKEESDSFDRKVDEWDHYSREDYDLSLGMRQGEGDKDEKLEALNNTEGRPMSLQEYLEQQVHLLPSDLLAEERDLYLQLCVAIIYNIDDRGYLLYSPDEIYQGLVDEASGRKASSGIPSNPGANGTGAAAVIVPAAEGAGAIVAAAPATNGSAPHAASPPSAPETKRGEASASAPPATPNGADLAAAPAERSAEAPAAPPDEDSSAAAAAKAAAAPPLAAVRQEGHADAEETVASAYGPLKRLPSRELFNRALAAVQSLDPPGVGGRNLKESLLLQLRRDGQAYPIETAIIENYLDDLGNNRLPKIAKALGINVEEVKSAAETIASLNPLPGNLFGGEGARFVKPDVVVEEVEGNYEVRVDGGYLPRLQVSSYYRDLYRSAGKDPELKKFVKKKLESAEWLISAIRQRQSTLLRVAQEIVRVQRGFLDHGISHLKPLKMVEVAETVGVHVSTISRAISGKYVQTPRGIFDLKFFFTGGSMKEDGTSEARGSLIQRIKELIDVEDKKSPLSDIDIVKKLVEAGIHISRRTVTKYREAENIPSSRQRRAY